MYPVSGNASRPSAGGGASSIADGASPIHESLNRPMSPSGWHMTPRADCIAEMAASSQGASAGELAAFNVRRSTRHSA